MKLLYDSAHAYLCPWGQWLSRRSQGQVSLGLLSSLQGICDTPVPQHSQAIRDSFLSCPLSFFSYFILLPNLLSSCFLPLLSYLLFTCAGMNTRASLCMSSSFSLKHTKCSFLFPAVISPLLWVRRSYKSSINLISIYILRYILHNFSVNSLYEMSKYSTHILEQFIAHYTLRGSQ